MCKQSFSVFHACHRLTCCKSMKRNHLPSTIMSLLLGHTQQEWIIYLFMFTYFHTICPECQQATGAASCRCSKPIKGTDRVKLVLPNPPIDLLWKYFCQRTDHKAMEYINVLNLLRANYIASDNGIKGRCKCCYSLKTAELVNTLATNLHSHNVNKITIVSSRRQFV